MGKIGIRTLYWPDWSSDFRLLQDKAMIAYSFIEFEAFPTIERTIDLFLKPKYHKR